MPLSPLPATLLSYLIIGNGMDMLLAGHDRQAEMSALCICTIHIDIMVIPRFILYNTIIVGDRPYAVDVHPLVLCSAVL